MTTDHTDGTDGMAAGAVRIRAIRVIRGPIRLGLAALLLIVPTICAADYDMTGLWRAAINGGGDAIFTITQTGTALQIQGQPPNDDVVGTGTIDPMTGVLSIQFSIVSPPTCGALFDGQLTPNGKALIAPGSIVSTSPDCHSLMCICEESVPAELRASRAPCGDGMVDVGEDCDDAALGMNGSCCAIDCTARPAGAACTSDQNLCTDDVCAALGVCTHPALADGTGCDDGQFCNGEETDCQAGICTTGSAPCPLACDEAADQCVTTCPSSPQSCRTAAKSLFSLKVSGDANRTKLRWKWLKGTATSQTEFGDPTDTADYALCLYGTASPQLVGDALIPAGASTWSTLGSSGYKYSDAGASAGGIERILLKGSAQNKSKVLIKGHGASLPFLSPPLTDPLIVQLYNGDTGLCWGAEYSVAQMIRNEVDQLKAKAP
jgi:hypothetical protein